MKRDEIAASAGTLRRGRAKENGWLKSLRRDPALYLMSLPGLAALILFCYVPMYGILMAFERYTPGKGILGSEWVGFYQFTRFFNSPYFGRIFGNTVILGVLTLLVSFPLPIILALLLNEVRHNKFKRTVQTISYMPYFVSVVIVVGLLKDMTSYNEGVINDLIQRLGGQRIDFFTSPGWFRPLYIASDVWSGIGYSSIIYLAAIAGVNPELYESAVLDGAGRFKQAVHITLPSIAPTVIVLLIFAVGGVVGNDMQKILLMQNGLNMSTSDVISTYVYREGLLGANYSYSTAVSLFTSVISLVLLLLTNYLSRKFTESSLF